MTKPRDTEIISVGTELLLGRVVNTDARDISEMLSKIGINGSSQFFGEFSLIFNGALYFLPTLLKIAQIGQTGFQGPKGCVVHGAVHFFSVTGNKGNGIAFIHQGDDIFNIFQFLPQFGGQNFSDRKHTVLLWFRLSAHHTTNWEE